MRYNIMELIFKKLLKVNIDLKEKSEIAGKDMPLGKNLGAGPAWWAPPVSPAQFNQKKQKKEKD